MKQPTSSTVYYLILCSLFHFSYLKSMEADCDCCCKYKQATEIMNTQFKHYRLHMFAEVPFARHTLEDIDDEKLILFKKKEVKTHGLLSFFKDNDELTKLFLAHVFYATKPKPKQFEKILQSYHSPDIILDKDDIHHVIKNYFVELFFQKFHKPVQQRELSACTCKKATLYDKIGCVIKTVSRLTTSFPPTDCTSQQPLSSTYSGSGGLLSEYLLSYILAKQGYRYQILYCIDRIYNHDSRWQSLFQEFKNNLENNGCNNSIKVFSTTSGFKQFKDINNIHNHLILAIDPGDHQEVDEADTIIQKASELYIMFINESFNNAHTIKIDFSDHGANTLEHSREIINPIMPNIEITKKMSDQIKSFVEKLNILISKKNDRETFIFELATLLKKKEQKYTKKDAADSYTVIEGNWFANPPNDFEKFARAIHTPSTLTLMVHYGVQEFDGQKFHEQ